MLAVLDVKEGDTVYITRADDNGLKSQAHDPAVLEALAASEAVMDENSMCFSRIQTIPAHYTPRPWGVMGRSNKLLFSDLF